MKHLFIAASLALFGTAAAQENASVYVAGGLGTGGCSVDGEFLLKGGAGPFVPGDIDTECDVGFAAFGTLGYPVAGPIAIEADLLLVSGELGDAEDFSMTSVTAFATLGIPFDERWHGYAGVGPSRITADFGNRFANAADSYWGVGFKAGLLRRFGNGSAIGAELRHQTSFEETAEDAPVNCVAIGCPTGQDITTSPQGTFALVTFRQHF